MKFLSACCLLVEICLGSVAVHTAPHSNDSSAVATQPGEGNQPRASTGGNAIGGVPPPAAAQHRARLDVGFGSFEKSMLDQVLVSIRNATAAGHWSDQLQTACKDNVTQELSQGLKSQLAPLKLSIGKTWMSLPEDEQKNVYVGQLRSSYEPVFQDTIATIGSQLQRSLKRLRVGSSHKKTPSQDDFVAQCASSITGNILSERCYDIGGEQHLKKKKVTSFLETKQNAPRNFCMPSVLEAMTRRLHDSQGLIGMTMQFESKSLSIQPAAPAALDDLVKQATAASH